MCEPFCLTVETKSRKYNSNEIYMYIRGSSSWQKILIYNNLLKYRVKFMTDFSSLFIRYVCILFDSKIAPNSKQAENVLDFQV